MNFRFLSFAGNVRVVCDHVYIFDYYYYYLYCHIILLLLILPRTMTDDWLLIPWRVRDGSREGILYSSAWPVLRITVFHCQLMNPAHHIPISKTWCSSLTHYTHRRFVTSSSTQFNINSYFSLSFVPLLYRVDVTVWRQTGSFQHLLVYPT